VKTGEIIVLGGLQRETQSKNTSRLGPIPFLGDLFGSRSRSKTRTDLVFFLRPTILTNTSDDNVKAMNQIEKFPDYQRAKLKSVLEPTGSAEHGNGN
jgi:general secretion pathway protein D